MLAVLEDAVACFQKYTFAREGKGKVIFQEAEEWIIEEGSDWPFSFENICELLGMDPCYVRQGLLRWKERKLAERPKAKIYHLISTAEKKKDSLKVSKRPDQRPLKVAVLGST